MGKMLDICITYVIKGKDTNKAKTSPTVPKCVALLRKLKTSAKKVVAQFLVAFLVTSIILRICRDLAGVVPAKGTVLGTA